MELKTCEYCGTAYDARLRQCPLCGRTAEGPAAPAEPERTSPVPEKSAQSAPAERPAPGRRLRQDAGAPKAARGYAGKRLRTASAPQPSDAQSAPGEAVYAIPKWMMTVLCVILGAAVLGGGRDGAAALGDEHGDLSVIAHRAVPRVVLPVERDLVDLAAQIDAVPVIRRHLPEWRFRPLMRIVIVNPKIWKVKVIGIGTPPLQRIPGKTARRCFGALGVQKEP